MRKNLEHRNDVLYIHVTLIPYIDAAEELKSKPTQHSVKELRSIGIQPDIIVCRTSKEVPEDMKRKIGLFCDVEPEAVISNLTAKASTKYRFFYKKKDLTRLHSKNWDLKTDLAI